MSSPYYWLPMLLVVWFLASAWMTLLVHPLWMFATPAAVVAYRLYREYQAAEQFVRRHMRDR